MSGRVLDNRRWGIHGGSRRWPPISGWHQETLQFSPDLFGLVSPLDPATDDVADRLLGDPDPLAELELGHPGPPQLLDELPSRKMA